MTFLFDYCYIEYSYCDTNKSNLSLDNSMIWCKMDAAPIVDKYGLQVKTE
jgi:hypothetical protein